MSDDENNSSNNIQEKISNISAADEKIPVSEKKNLTAEKTNSTALETISIAEKTVSATAETTSVTKNEVSSTQKENPTKKKKIPQPLEKLNDGYYYYSKAFNESLNNWPVLKRILNTHDPERELRNLRDETPIFKAVLRDVDPQIVANLIDLGYRVNDRSVMGLSPLLIAFIFRRERHVPVLLDNGADIEVKDNNDFGLLDCVDNFQDRKIVNLLVEHMRSQLEYSQEQIVDLMEASGVHPVCVADDLELLFAYIRRTGVDVNSVDEEGYSLMDVAVKEGNLELMTFLIERGVDVNKTYEDWSLLCYAAKQGRHITGRDYMEMLELLLDHGARIDWVHDSTGMNVLHVVAKYGSTEVMQMLLSRGADLMVKDKEGKSVLNYAENNPKQNSLILLNEIRKRNGEDLENEAVASGFQIEEENFCAS